MVGSRVGLTAGVYPDNRARAGVVIVARGAIRLEGPLVREERITYQTGVVCTDRTMVDASSNNVAEVRTHGLLAVAVSSIAHVDRADDRILLTYAAFAATVIRPTLLAVTGGHALTISRTVADARVRHITILYRTQTLAFRDEPLCALGLIVLIDHASAHSAEVVLIARGASWGVGVLASERGGDAEILYRAVIVVIADVIPFALSCQTGIWVRALVFVIARLTVTNWTARLARDAAALVPIGAWVSVFAVRGVSTLRSCGVDKRALAVDAIIGRALVVVIARSADPTAAVASAHLAIAVGHADALALIAHSLRALGAAVAAAPVITFALADAIGDADATAAKADPLTIDVTAFARQAVWFGFVATCRRRRNRHIVILTGITRANILIIADKERIRRKNAQRFVLPANGILHRQIAGEDPVAPLLPGEQRIKSSLYLRTVRIGQAEAAEIDKFVKGQAGNRADALSSIACPLDTWILGRTIGAIQQLILACPVPETGIPGALVPIVARVGQFQALAANARIKGGTGVSVITLPATASAAVITAFLAGAVRDATEVRANLLDNLCDLYEGQVNIVNQVNICRN